MNDIFRVSANGGTPQQISSDRYTNEFFAAPAPDGNSILRFRLAVSPTVNGGATVEATLTKAKSGSNAATIMNRFQIAARNSSGRCGARTANKYFMFPTVSGAQNIWTQTVKGQPKQLTNFKTGRVLWANISYDGRQIVFERDFKIWTLDTDGGNAKEVAITLRGLPSGNSNERKNFGTQVSEFSLSPDGKKIAVVAHGEIFAASSKDGGEAVRITETPAAESFAVWSPDSKTIVYTSERNGKLQIFQYDFANETETQLTQNGDDYSHRFFHRTENICVYSQRSFALDL